MNIFILPISFLVLVGISNSVNLTDGLDGLAAGCSGIVFYGLGTEILMKEQQELFVFSILMLFNVRHMLRISQIQ